MIRRALRLLPALAVAGSCLLGAASPATAEDPIVSPFPEEEMARLMARYEEVSTPGPAHQRLEAFVGSWKTTTRVWLGGPGAAPALSAGTSEIEWILGGRFLLERTEGVAGDGEAEEEVEGLGLIGYDNLAGRYDATWVDSGNTTTYRSTGTWNEERRALILSGDREDPLTGEIGTFEYVRRILDEDTFVFEIHDLSLGAKVVEITYARD